LLCEKFALTSTNFLFKCFKSYKSSQILGIPNTKVKTIQRLEIIVNILDGVYKAEVVDFNILQKKANLIIFALMGQAIILLSQMPILYRKLKLIGKY